VLLLDPSEISIVSSALSKSLSKDATKFRSAFLLLENIGWSTGGEARSYAKHGEELCKAWRYGTKARNADEWTELVSSTCSHLGDATRRISKDWQRVVNKESVEDMLMEEGKRTMVDARWHTRDCYTR
jgi:hypothetical protein